MSNPTIACTVTLVDEGAIPITFDQRAVFGRARPPLVVTINDYSYRSTIAIMNGVTFVPLRRSHREAAGVADDETVRVTLTLDAAPREVEPPEALAAGLDAHDLRVRWEALSFTQRREDAEAIEGAKREETRARRLAAIVRRLSCP